MANNPDNQKKLDYKIEVANKSLKIYERNAKRIKSLVHVPEFATKTAELNSELEKQNNIKIELQKEILELNKKINANEKKFQLHKKLKEGGQLNTKERGIIKVQEAEDKKTNEVKKMFDNLKENPKRDEKIRELNIKEEKLRKEISQLKIKAIQYRQDEEEVIDERFLKDNLNKTNDDCFKMRKKYKEAIQEYKNKTKKLAEKLSALEKV